MRSDRPLLTVAGVAAACFAALAIAYPTRGGAVANVDRDVSHWVADEMPSWAEWLARPLTWLGGGVALPLLTLAAAAIAWRRRDRIAAVFLLAVLASVTLLVWLLKLGFDRERPALGAAIPLPDSPSFPSGHAASGVAVFGAFAVVVAWRRPSPRDRTLMVAAGVALGVAIGASRVVLGVHYVSDVLAGYCLGLAVLCVAVTVLRRVAGPSAPAGTIAS